MKRLLSLLWIISPLCLAAQAPPQWNSAETGLRLKKLGVLGSVLYIAAHPDDENTRLLAFLAKEKLYRTGYLSLTRGDGGQNLIGDEQGVELGLIRTQELLAARRIDGAEQFFSRAYDFGFSKSTDEALRLWGKDRILADAVWVIRKFRPDVIITRFPPDSRAGHGQHSASAVIAQEAFIAAADPGRFPEQLTQGVTVWQAKRILWNTFNFGSTNTTAENQFKLEVGTYQPMLGKSYGEIAADSRSQHKSQGFGVPAQRGSSIEYFQPVSGDMPVNELLDGVNSSWDRLEGAKGLGEEVQQVIRDYDYAHPEKSVHALTHLYQGISLLKDGYWKTQKLKEVQQLVEQCGGLFLEAWTAQEYAVQDDSLRVNFFANNRSGVPATLKRVTLEYADSTMEQLLGANKNVTFLKSVHVPPSKAITQPYWLADKMEGAYYNVSEQKLIGLPENPPAYLATFYVEIDGVPFHFDKPVMYKHTDPVKGEIYQPVPVIPPLSLNSSPGVLLFRKGQKDVRKINLTATAYTKIPPSSAVLSYRSQMLSGTIVEDTMFQLSRGMSHVWTLPVDGKGLGDTEKDVVISSVQYKNEHQDQADYLAMAQINYDHIPSIRYFYPDGVTLLNLDLKTAGRKIGYIKGAGDKVPEALEQMGYSVTQLGEKDMNAATLAQYDAIVAGIRAYNVLPWLDAAYDVLMGYVRQGGNYVVQYNTASFGPAQKFRAGPYDFTLSRNRVTDETAAVGFTDPKDPMLNWPNAITQKDFDGWIQERGIYFATQQAADYRTPLSMKDPGEAEDKGSLIVCNYGKGRFIYTGLVFFRELPAGISGAYRLFANLVSNPNAKINGTK
jgi:LmbE family N-acetylglucosaminyl deacetylase